MGTLPLALTKLHYLTDLRLGFNNITGTIPPELFSNRLGTLILRANFLSGVLPEEIGRAKTLSVLDLTNNSLYGTIPDSVSGIDWGPETTLDLRGNYFHCCGRNYNGNLTMPNYAYFDMDAPRLPSFLQQSKLYFSYQEVYNALLTTQVLFSLRCPSFHLTGTEDTPENTVNVLLDVEYYMFEGCSCGEGLELTRTFPEPWFDPIRNVAYGLGNVPTFDCQLIICAEAWYDEQPWALALLVCGSIVVLSVIVWGFIYYSGVHSNLVRWVVSVKKRTQGEPTKGKMTILVALVEWVVSVKKRTQGEPTKGKMTILVALVEDYDRLMFGLGTTPHEGMVKGMQLYQNVLKKACWANFAHVLNNDSGVTTILFPEEMDAVTLSLQVQQALMMQDWPKDMLDGHLMEPRELSKTKQTNMGTKAWASVKSASAKSIGGIKKLTGHHQKTKPSVSSLHIPGKDMHMERPKSGIGLTQSSFSSIDLTEFPHAQWRYSESKVKSPPSGLHGDMSGAILSSRSVPQPGSTVGSEQYQRQTAIELALSGEAQRQKLTQGNRPKQGMGKQDEAQANSNIRLPTDRPSSLPADRFISQAADRHSGQGSHERSSGTNRSSAQSMFSDNSVAAHSAEGRRSIILTGFRN
eukprot:gene8122-1369_t